MAVLGIITDGNRSFGFLWEFKVLIKTWGTTGWWVPSSGLSNAALNHTQRERERKRWGECKQTDRRKEKQEESLPDNSQINANDQTARPITGLTVTAQSQMYSHNLSGESANPLAMLSWTVTTEKPDVYGTADKRGRINIPQRCRKKKKKQSSFESGYFKALSLELALMGHTLRSTRLFSDVYQRSWTYERENMTPVEQTEQLNHPLNKSFQQAVAYSVRWSNGLELRKNQRLARPCWRRREKGGDAGNATVCHCGYNNKLSAIP